MARKVKPSERLEKVQETEKTKMREVYDYEHGDKMRVNNPPVGMAQYDTRDEQMKAYEYDPHIDPSLQWAGKAEHTSFEIPTSSIHVHEVVKPLILVSSFLKKYSSTEYTNGQTTLWHQESDAESLKKRTEKLEFYQHDVNWTNRLIAGDSLVIMNSLLEKEGMSGQVQMIYFDPPYGIKYGSNFQPYVDQTAFKSQDKDVDLTQEPEMIKAFRDTWELGIHSYLTYIRDRLLLSRDLLSNTGSIFIQISDENLHYIRSICDEIFGAENFVSQITVKKGSVVFAKKLLNSATFFIIWYAKNKETMKYHNLYTNKDYQWFANSATSHLWAEDPKTHETIRPTPEERKNIDQFLAKHPGFKLYRLLGLNAQGNEKTEKYEFNGKFYTPPRGTQWKTSFPEGLDKLKEAGRLQAEDKALNYKMYYDDYPIITQNNLWDKIGAVNDKIYVVQTANELPSRCMLMSTDPGDLVLDITCGSGTTAYVAEKYGRRWITCDTSRVALTLAKQRLMTATFDYYELAHPEQGVGSGFIYKTAKHITLGSIANNEPAPAETLYDQPNIVKGKVRVTGPFTVEALPSPVVKPISDTYYHENTGKKQQNYIDQLYATGILGRGGNRIHFSRIEPLSGTRYLHADAETREENPRRAVICFGSDTAPLDSRVVNLALREAEKLRPSPQLIIFAAFQFDPEGAKDIEETIWPDVTLLKVQINPDLMTDDLKKKRSSDQSFFLIGQPDVEVIELGDNKYQVKVNGFDYYNVNTGIVESGPASRIAMWMLDTHYDGMTVNPKQIFFPLGGKKGGWQKLADSLRSEVDTDLLSAYSGNESLPFEIKETTQIAVKIIDDRGVESLKVFDIGD